MGINQQNLPNDRETSAQSTERLGGDRNKSDMAVSSRMEYIATASHGLVQPLQTLKLLSSVLADRPNKAPPASVIDGIVEATRTLERLVGAIITIEKTDAGMVVPDIRPARIAPILDRLVDEFARRGARLDRTLLASIEDAVVDIDPEVFADMLRHLLSIALLDASGKGGFRLSSKIEDGNPLVCVSWTSEARALAQTEAVERRSDGTAEGEAEDVLALMATQCLATLMGLEIQILSDEGKEVAFVVEMLTSGEANLPEMMGVEASSSTSPLSIVLVDDDRVVLGALRLRFERWGHTVLATTDWRRAAAAWRVLGKIPDMLVVEHRMQGADSISAVDGLRAAIGHDVPALVITGEAGHEELRRIAEHGLRVLRKPAEPAALAVAIHDAARGRSFSKQRFGDRPTDHVCTRG